MPRSRVSRARAPVKRQNKGSSVRRVTADSAGPEPVVPGSVPRGATPRRPLLREAPHAHAVCRVCGRISEVELSTEDSLRLETLVARPPDGWAIEVITVGMTGGCPRCRANGSV